jgi:hypothetical protein
MKVRIAVSALWLAAAAAAPAVAQFEGVADFKVTMHGEPGQSVQSLGKMYISRDGYRSEWATSLSKVHTDGSAGSSPPRITMTMLGKRADPDRLYMLNDASKTYSVMDLKSMRDETKDEHARTYTVQRGGSDTVAGMACQKATVTSSRGDVFDACVSKEWGGSSEWISALTRGRSSGSWFSALKENGIEGYPVRLAMRGKAGAEPMMVWEVTHVERKSLPASLFEVPTGYKKTDSALGGLTPEQQKALSDARGQMDEALKNMTPEQRKAYEDAMRKYGQPTPRP